MDLPLSDHRMMSVQEFDTSKLLEKAAAQARQRGYRRFPIVDVDSHHYEMAAFPQIVSYIEDPVLRQLAMSSAMAGAQSAGILQGHVGTQDMGGRVTRYPLRSLEKTPGPEPRDVQLTRRWMDAIGIDLAVLFPTPMLLLGLHPQVEVEVAMARAYNRWLVETVLSVDPRIKTMLYLPFNDAEATYKMVQEFSDAPGVVGFMVTSARYRPVHHNSFIKTYALLEEKGMPLAFHAGYNWNDQSLSTLNKFISVHAVGFVLHNIIHLTNWIMNGLPERFPKLPVIWIESGLAWVPFLMQRLDHEYMMRPSEAPALKRLPSEYMKEMFYTSQPMERPKDPAILEMTFKMINAETQLMYSSDYPHWDFDLPSVIYDLPFLSEAAKQNILGGNALRVFGLDSPVANRIASSAI
jgi:predicted TIM-barrel fold metal-dependent hydrolase